ncbi:MAG: helix-turn-helix transcriptional regulator, partial [Porticoccaceae bacterium]
RACAEAVGGGNKLSDLTGIGRRTLENYFKNESEPTASKLVLIASTANRSIRWLLIGEEQAADMDAEFGYVPKLDVEVSAGHGTQPCDESPGEVYAFRKAWLAGKGLSVRSLAVLTARGDSMEPTIPDGSTLLIDTSANTLVQEGIYAVRLDESLYVKRLQRSPGGNIVLISDNPLYAQQTVHREHYAEHFKIIGKVVWVGHDV